MTDVSNLDNLAAAIATSSAKIRNYAKAQAAATQSQELDIQTALSQPGPPVPAGSTLGWFNVKDYGAVGDGTNDTVAIQAALNAAGVEGGVCYFPPGFYAITATLTWPRGVRIQGAYGATTGQSFYPRLIWYGAAGGTMIEVEVSGSTGPAGHARYMVFDGRATNTAGKIINSAERIDWDFGFYKCHFIRCNGDAITLALGCVNLSLDSFRADMIGGYLVKVTSEMGAGRYILSDFSWDTGTYLTARGLLDYTPQNAGKYAMISVSDARLELNEQLAGNKTLVQLNLVDSADPMMQAFVGFNNVFVTLVPGATGVTLVKNSVATTYDSWAASGQNVTIHGSTGALTEIAGFQMAVGATATGPPAGKQYPFWVFAPLLAGGATNSPPFLQRTWLGGRVDVDGKLLASDGIGVGNSAAATTPGSVVKKMQVFDEAGSSLGFVPIYDGIA